MKLYHIGCIIVTIIVMFSCKNESNMAQFIPAPQNIRFPNDLILIDNDYSLPFNGVNAKAKIIVNFDSLVCGPCAVTSLRNWTEIVDTIESFKGDASIVFVFSPSDEDMAPVYEMLKENPLCYPLYFDESHSFAKINKMPKGAFICLVNETDSVLYYGNPLREPFWNEYQNKLDSLLN